MLRLPVVNSDTKLMPKINDPYSPRNPYPVSSNTNDQGSTNRLFAEFQHLSNGTHNTMVLLFKPFMRMMPGGY